MKEHFNFEIVLVIILFLFVVSAVLLFLLFRTRKELNRVKESNNRKKQRLNNHTQSVDLSKYNELLLKYKDLESKMRQLTLTNNEDRNEASNYLGFETTVPMDPGNTKQRNTTEWVIENTKNVFNPLEYYFDEFNNGIYQKNAKEDSRRCVYKITTSEEGLTDKLELVLSEKVMNNYIINKNIYLPTHLCSISYLPGGNQSRIQNVIPGKVHFEDGEWIIDKKILLEII
jgi:hypothetical protein